MRVLISADGKHDPTGLHLMQVDDLLLLIDLSGVAGTLVDPAITKVEWAPTVYGGQSIEAGQITRRDGHRQMFFERGPLEPYLTAFHDRAAHLAQQQAAYRDMEMSSVTLAALADDEVFGPVVVP